MINLIPLVLYFAWDFPATLLIYYFILETLVYCLIQFIFIGFGYVPMIFGKILFTAFSLAAILLSVYFIPKWNPDEPAESERIAFWNYFTVLICFYTIDFYLTGEKYQQFTEEDFKLNVVRKFSVLLFICIAGFALGKYAEASVAYLVTIVLTKSVIDFFALKTSAPEDE